jgi:hypothetical protein
VLARSHRLLLCWCLLILTGCPSYGLHLTPRPTPVGTTEVGTDIEGIGYSRPGQSSPFSVPFLSVGARRGLIDGVDFGVKVWSLGGKLDSRIALVRSPRFDLSVVPGAKVETAGYVVNKHDVLGLGFEAPLLFGFKPSKWVTFVAGARFGARYNLNGEDLMVPADVPPWTLLPGGTFGVELRTAETFALFPELNVLTPYNLTTNRFIRPIWQGGLEFQFRVF